MRPFTTGGIAHGTSTMARTKPRPGNGSLRRRAIRTASEMTSATASAVKTIVI
jgi:hypothetical protein